MFENLLCIQQQKAEKGYVNKRSDSQCWRFPCCKRRLSIFHKSIFYNIKLNPGQLLEILWKVASRTPVSLIPILIFGKPKSEVYAHISFFREVAGYYEDKYPIKMGGIARYVEGDGMFVIGKRKCGVGRFHTKEHVYVCIERGSRKIQISSKR